MLYMLYNKYHHYGGYLLYGIKNNDYTKYYW